MMKETQEIKINRKKNKDKKLQSGAVEER